MLNTASAKSILDSLAAEVRYVDRGVVFVPDPKKEEGEPAGEAPVKKVVIEEYSLGGYEDAVTEHALWVDVLIRIINDMPSATSILFWRETPRIERQFDFDGQKWKHYVYLRCAWLPLEL